MEKKETNEVVVVIPGSEYHHGSIEHQGSLSSRPLIELPELNTRIARPPQDVAKLSSSTLTRRIVTKSSFSKPKSRFEEPTYKTTVEVKSQVENGSTSSVRTSPMATAENTDAKATNPNNNLKSELLTPPAPLIKLGSGEDDDDEDDEVYDTANLKIMEISGKKKLSKFVLLEWIAFLFIMAVLIASLTVDRMREIHIWGTILWRWCVLVLVIFCGRLVAECLMDLLVFMIEQNFLLKQKVLYFVFGLKKAVQVFIWIAMVLLAWSLLINLGGPKRSKHTTRVFNRITRGIAACLVGAALWFIKTLLIKLLASNFQCKRFFDRIQESLYHQYIVRILSGPPTMEMAEKVGAKSSINNSGRLSFRKAKKDGAREGVINFNMEKLQNMKPGKVSFWTMKALVDVIGGSRLSTLSGVLDRYDDRDDEEKKNEEITSKLEAKAAAYRIFINVAKHTEYIDEENLLRFLKEQEIDRVMSLFEGAAEKRQIERSVFKKWLIKVYQERKSLALSLNDAKTAIEELNRLVSGILVIVIIIVWLLVTGFLDTKVLVFLSSQLLVAVFIFGNTAKTIFEAIIFVFVMHPYDVGDRCVIDGVQMTVEEVNLLTTIFLRYDSEKIFYPNSVLATKPISNFYRSPEMGDSVEFAIDFSTPVEHIAALKSQIKSYIDGKSEHWRSGHSVVIKEIEDISKLKLGLYVTHTINFQDSGERSKRRSSLVLELKRILEELKIKYHLLPQEVVISNAGSPAAFVQ